MSKTDETENINITENENETETQNQTQTPKLPKDGTKVRGFTYASIEYDRSPIEVTGTFLTTPSPFGDPPQCWIDGVQVDPSTVKLIKLDTTPESKDTGG